MNPNNTRQSYYCPECKGTTYDVDYCDNPDCPNMPCCGRPGELCDCWDAYALADDDVYMQIINYGMQWVGKNPLNWKTGQDVVNHAKSKHKIYLRKKSN